MKKMTYADSGVDIHAENRSIDAMRRVLTTRRRALEPR
jgi:phosphoribosylaminoimidazole (AIR) synthetase